MGYYTKFEMDFTGNVAEKDIIAALREINPNYFDHDVEHLDTLVCYVSDKPNRNRSVITKEVANQLANL